MGTKPYPEVPDDAGIEGYSPSFIDINGVRTRYYDIGEGDPLVLIHGGTWKGHASANTWTKTFEHLEDDFRLVAFDRIGCGLTGNPSDPSEFVYETDLRHGFGFLNELGIDSCHLAGWSRGGGMAARMAVEEPERFRTLVINNSATLGPPVTDASHIRSKIFKMDERGIEPSDPEYTRTYYEQYSYQTDYITDLRCRTAAHMQSQPKFDEAAEILAEQEEGETWQATLQDHMNTTHTRIKEGVLDMPVLYMYGINDLTVPLEMSTAAYQLIASNNARARMKTLNKCGHMAFLEHPEEFSYSVTNFIDWWSRNGC